MVFLYLHRKDFFTNQYSLEKLCTELWKFNAIYQYMILHWINLHKIRPLQKKIKRVYKDDEERGKGIKGGDGGYKWGKWGKWGKKNKKK
mgnify:CR=1 FL=1